MFNNYILYIFKIIKHSIIFRSIIFFISTCLIFIGVDRVVVSGIVTCIVVICITYCIWKSKNKLKCTIKTVFNLSIVYFFWNSVYTCFDSLYIGLFVCNYITLINKFDYSCLDIDFSDVMRSLDLPRECISDLEDIHNNEPIPGKFGPIYDDVQKRDLSAIYLGDPLKKLQHHPGLINYKKCFVSDRSYPVSEISRSIELNNKLSDIPAKSEMCVQRGIAYEINWERINSYRLASLVYGFSAQDHYKYLLNDNYAFKVELNTLTKAKCYYLDCVKNSYFTSSDNSYKYAFETWQKRQIGYSLVHILPFICYKAGLYNISKHSDILEKIYALNAKKSNLKITNFFDDKEVYHEILENILYVTLRIIQTKAVINEIESGSIDLDNLPISQYKILIAKVMENCVKKHQEWFDLLYQQYLDSNDLSKLGLESMCRYRLHSAFLHPSNGSSGAEEIHYKDLCNNQSTLKSRISGFGDTRLGESKIFEWKGCVPTLYKRLYLFEQKISFYDKQVIVSPYLIANEKGGDCVMKGIIRYHHPDTMLSKIPAFSCYDHLD